MAERDTRRQIELTEALKTPALILFFAYFAYYFSNFCFPKQARGTIFRAEPLCRQCGEKGAEDKIVVYQEFSREDDEKRKKKALENGEEVKEIIVMEAHHKCYERVAKKYGLPDFLYHHPSNGTTYCAHHHDKHHKINKRLTDEEELDQIRGLLERVVEFHTTNSSSTLNEMFKTNVLLAHPNTIRNTAEELLRELKKTKTISISQTRSQGKVKRNKSRAKGELSFRRRQKNYRSAA